MGWKNAAWLYYCITIVMYVSDLTVSSDKAQKLQDKQQVYLTVKPTNR